jgi:hypothetical protein
MKSTTSAGGMISAFIWLFLVVSVVSLLLVKDGDKTGSQYLLIKRQQSEWFRSENLIIKKTETGISPSLSGLSYFDTESNPASAAYWISIIFLTVS